MRRMRDPQQIRSPQLPHFKDAIMNQRSMWLGAGVLLLALGGGVWIGRISGRTASSDPQAAAAQAWQLMLNDGSISATSPEAPGIQRITDRDEPVELPDDPDVAFFPSVVAQSSAQVPTRSMADEQRAIWDKELSNLTPQAAHEILTLRTQLGSVAAMSLGLSDIDSAASAPAVLTLPTDGSLKPAGRPATIADRSAPTAIQTVAGSASATGQQKLLGELATVTRHNSANLATPGFKRTEVLIVASLATDLRCVRRIDLRPGEIFETSNPFDLAIDGPGWFVVTSANGTPGLTRAGLLAVTADGKLGLAVAGGTLPLKPEVALPKDATSVLIDANGTCRVWLSDQTQPVSCGSIKLATCLNPSQLSRANDGLLLTSEHSGTTWQGSPGQRGLGLLRQGSLERSNARDEDDQRMLRAIAAMSGFGPATVASDPLTPPGDSETGRRSSDQ